MRILRGLYVTALMISVAAPCVSPKTPAPRSISKPVLQITPLPVVISDPREMRRVLISMKQPDGRIVDVTPVARLKTTSDVVKIDDAGLIHPLKDGQGTVEVEAEGITTHFDVTVQGFGRNRPIGFVKDVMPILGKAGCNSGACHGGAKGKNGFKLSLRGYDPNFDYAALIHDLSGRRFNRAVPEESLMLLKPTMGVAHGGGQRFPAGSPYYKTLLEWIRQGVSYADEKEGAVVKLDVVPPEIFMNKPGLTQQVLALAHYPDGSQRDVTAESIYISGTPSVAEVSDTGVVKSLRKGETTIQVRYQGQSVSVPLTAVTEKPGFKWTQLPQHNYIDRLVDEKLKRLKVLPSTVCTDAEFMRRVFLDLIGLLPRPEDIRTFLEDPTESQLKRGRLIDKLLASPEYVDHWSLKWGDLLLSNRRFLGEKGLWSYRNWIRQSIAENKPYDQFVREIVVASGSTHDNPPSNFFRATREPKAMMETASQLFLGVRMMCANCHDHPFEPWTQRNYYEMTAFFGGVTLKEGAQNDEEIVYEKRHAYEIRHPKYGYLVPAKFPFAGPDQVDTEKNRREQFAAWLTSKDNPYFAVAISNRIWSYFFPRGIIDPVDDLRPSNPPSNPALLAALAADLRRNRMDLKQLMRRITTSRIYQTSYRSNEWNEDDEPNFSHQRPRRLSAEALLDAVSLATGSSTDFEGVPKGYRAQQLPDSRVGVGGFLDLFGRPARESSCECERRGDISLAQALNLVNGGVVADGIADPDGRVARLILSGASDQKIVEELYLATLSRPPDENELASSIKHLKDGNNRTERAQDLLWALLNSHGFLFNR
jgi:Protein of unknown function (DUF1549)/Protein of unknown function (DUF1553)